MEQLNSQLLVWREKLISELRIKADSVDSILTDLTTEVRSIAPNLLTELSSDPVGLKNKANTLKTLQHTADVAEAGVCQVIANNYACFVFLKESFWSALKQESEVGTILKKCSKFLLSKPVREFRAAVITGDWVISGDSSEVEFWAHKGDWRNDSIEKQELDIADLIFWQTLSLTVAYVTYLVLDELAA